MEDSHIAHLDLTADCHLFGVFDGHGGKEVAKYVKKHFCEYFKNNKSFQAGNIELALKETFMLMD